MHCNAFFLTSGGSFDYVQQVENFPCTQLSVTKAYFFNKKLLTKYLYINTQRNSCF
jgi:hypothetical protein